MNDEMQDIIVEFLAETNESLNELDHDLLSLEQNPDDEALISNIFRVLHTIKGTCGFLGLPRLEKIAHKGEDVMGLVRDGDLVMKAQYATVIFEAFDEIKKIVVTLEDTGLEPEGDDTQLLKKLEDIYNRKDLANEANAETDDDNQDEGFQFTNGDLDTTDHQKEDKEPNRDQPQAFTNLKSKSNQNKSLRVNVDVLEDLMTMISELVLTRNQLMQIQRQNQEGSFSHSLQRLNHVVSGLQESVMKTRMQPIGNAWSKLPRIVRDISNSLGKDIELEMIGQDAELDREILEMIKDPLTHMVRNSADHGIETPDVRRMAGKPTTGKIILKAYHQGGHIIIEISDDGHGLSMDRIKNKMQKQNLVSEEDLSKMSVQQIQQYIFHAGFSTASEVTSVSGRGVGMDVVRSNIEKIGGSIDLTSKEGEGTKFKIKIPLTLAIVSALILGVGEHRFAIPQLAISELVMVGQTSGNRIENINNSKVLRLRDKLLPLIDLNEVLQINDDRNSIATAGKNGDAKYVVVIRTGNTDFGVIVDNVYDLEEIVIKPLPKNLKKMTAFSGNTILGDGCVIMILDPNGVMNLAGIKDASDLEGLNDEVAETHIEPEHLMLLFKAGNESVKAIPVDQISRLEDIDLGNIERSNGSSVIQYSGKLMPIFDIDDGPQNRESRPLIIVHNNGLSAGLLVDQILDIAKYKGELAPVAHNHSKICESLIINGKATDVVNTHVLTDQGVSTEKGVLSYA